MLSILVLSCRRLRYLEHSVEAAQQHFETVETEVRPIWICFDNGSPPDEQRELVVMDLDVLFLSRRNLGVGPAMNRVIAAVRTPYFLNLQDDWLLENPKGVHFVEESIRIMESDPNIAQVKLDNCHFLDFDDRKVYDGPFSAKGGAVDYYVQNPKMLWGGFAFPPAITRTSAVHEIGPFTEDQPFRRGWAESEYSARFAERFHAAKSPEMLLFKHIGEEASPGWAGDDGPTGGGPRDA